MKKITFDTIILGGGISGLVAAFNQQKQGKTVLLLEASNRFGGVIKTVIKEGYRLEQGPNSILTNVELYELIKELGIEEKVRKNEAIASTRYLLFKGMPLKMKPSWALLSSGFLKFGMAWAFLTERFRKKRTLNEESIAAFIRRRLNADILNRMINPLVTGVYAGDPENLSLRSTFKKLYAMEQDYGSLVKAMFNRGKNGYKREAMSFEGGLSTLTNALADKLGENALLNTSVTAIKPIENGFEIKYKQEGVEKALTSKKTISTLPPTVLSSIYKTTDNLLKKELEAIEYAPMLLVYLGYSKASIGQGLNGFGYLIPQQEKQPYLGGIWTSTIFPEVAPEGMALFTLFVGGVNNKAVITNIEESVEKAKLAFERHMKITSNPTFQSHYLHERAIPQFNLGYYKLMQKVDAIEAQHKGLKIAGNWRTGVAIGDCVAENINLQ